VKLTTHFYPVPRPRMSGAKPRLILHASMVRTWKTLPIFLPIF